MLSNITLFSQELVWEKFYDDVLFNDINNPYQMSFDLASDTNKMLLVNTFFYDFRLSPSVDSTQITLFEVDINTGSDNEMLAKVTAPNYYIPTVIEKDNGTLNIFMEEDITLMRFGYKLRKMRVTFSENGISLGNDPSYYRYIIDTSAKGHVPIIPALDGIKNMHYKNGGLISKSVHHRDNEAIPAYNYPGTSKGDYNFVRLGTKDTLSLENFDTLSKGNLLDDIIADLELDTTEIKLSLASTKITEIDSNNYLLMGLIKYGQSPISLIVNFNDTGHIISKKYQEYNSIDIGEVLKVNTNTNSIFINTPNGYIAEYTLEGEFVRQHHIDYMNSPILSQYDDENDDDIVGRLYFNDKNELYVYGGVAKKENNNSMGAYSCYIAKYDTNMNLLFEKKWQLDGYEDCVLYGLLEKDSCIYVKGKVDKKRQPELGVVDTNTLYLAKFKEPTVGIEEEQLTNLTISPNPANEKLTINYGENIIKEVELYDISGKLLNIFSNIEATITTLNISHLQSGVYFLKIDGKTIKFVKE
jgi:hypothetical protein